MKTLHKYLTGQVLATLLLTVSVFAFVVLLLNVLHDVLPLLFGGHIGFLLLCKAIGLLIPFVLVPLADLAPDLIVPCHGPVATLLGRVDRADCVAIT